MTRPVPPRPTLTPTRPDPPAPRLRAVGSSAGSRAGGEGPGHPPTPAEDAQAGGLAQHPVVRRAPGAGRCLAGHGPGQGICVLLPHPGVRLPVLKRSINAKTSTSHGSRDRAGGLPHPRRAGGGFSAALLPEHPFLLALAASPWPWPPPTAAPPSPSRGAPRPRAPRLSPLRRHLATTGDSTELDTQGGGGAGRAWPRFLSPASY